MSLAYTADGNIREQRYLTAITKAQFTPTGLYTDTYDIQPSQEFVFDYKYDNLKRLQRAELKRAGSSVFTLGETGNLNPGVTYDANGNILTMKRIAGGVTVDNLTYGYNAANPNQLTSIADGGTTTYAKASTYKYYTDGSVKKDAGRGINDGGITYNNQKLVSKMVANGVNYEYIYSNSGQKLQMKYGSKTYDYIGNAVYLNDTLEFAGNPEGRWIPAERLRVYNPNKTAVALPTVAKYGRYEYQLKDHLGNLRASCRCLEKPNATLSNQAYPTLVTQENHYDPWGVAIEQEVVADKIKLPNFELRDRFTYNGKELQGTLNYLDYGARMYDPSIGRWGVVDPLAEKMQSWSTYHYTFDNPVKYIDYDGLIPMPVNKLFKGMVHRIDSWFGPRNTGIKGASKFHKGLDINFGSGRADKGAPVLTTHDGVATIDDDPSGKEGRMVIVTSTDGKFRTKYLHLSKINIDNKQEVNEAFQIGEIGGSGYGSETGQQTHLHYSIEKLNEETGRFEAYNPTEGKSKKEDNIVDPQTWLQKKTEVKAGPQALQLPIIEIDATRVQRNLFFDGLKNLKAGKYNVVDGKIIP